MKKYSALFFLLIAQPTFTPSAFAAKYDIDQSHTSIEFKVSHLGISSVRGNFADVKGEFDFDAKEVEKSSVAAEINVTSIDTKNGKRDEHLKSPDFLEEKKFPTITFKSKKISKVSDKKFNAAGDLTIHGITKEVILEVEQGGVAQDPWGSERAAFSATTLSALHWLWLRFHRYRHRQRYGQQYVPPGSLPAR